jgi:AcrR family transcriptional regulator
MSDGVAAQHQTVSSTGASAGKAPRTARGQRTLRGLLDAAASEFGEKGFHEGSISGITRRAGVALGTFYTYFDSKDAVFRALVRDMSEQVRDRVAPALRGHSDQIAAEQAALEAFIRFAREHKEIYRIIDEAEFVDPESFRQHYARTAERIQKRLEAAAERGEVRPEVGEVHAWAIMGMNVFLGLRYSVWADDAPADEIARTAAAMLRRGLGVLGDGKAD